jgi:hypothetical protein
MAVRRLGPACAADGCLRPRFEAGLCELHRNLSRAFGQVQDISIKQPGCEEAGDSIAICEAIWNVS